MIPFLCSISRKIKFGTNQALLSLEDKSLFDAIKKIYDKYLSRGFHIKIILADKQFESLREKLLTLGITLNCVAENEHVPEIERHQRHLKERTCCKFNALPFKIHPIRMIIENVEDSGL